MTNRDGRVSRAIRVANEDLSRVVSDLAHARRTSGLSREAVARATGLSRSSLQRLESGSRQGSVRELAAVGAAVGLDVRLRAYQAGDPIRDAGQLRLLERLRGRLDPALGWRTEVPIPLPGDPRAWDAVISAQGWRVAVEAETVLDDLQALERRIGLKSRDGRIDRVILLVADTRRNRRALAGAPMALPSFTRDARRILSALRRGEEPGSGGVVVL